MEASLSLSLFSLSLSLSLFRVHMQTRVIHPADQAKQVEERQRVRVDHKDLAGLRGPVSESRALELLQQHRPEVSSEVLELLGPISPDMNGPEHSQLFIYEEGRCWTKSSSLTRQAVSQGV